MISDEEINHQPEISRQLQTCCVVCCVKILLIVSIYSRLSNRKNVNKYL